MEHSPTDVSPEGTDQAVCCALGLVRTLWSDPPYHPHDQAESLRNGSTLDLAARLRRECPDSSAEVCQAVAAKWIAAHEPVLMFSSLCRILSPAGIAEHDARYMAMRAIRRKYGLSFSSSTARLIHLLADHMSKIAANTPEWRIDAIREEIQKCRLEQSDPPETCNQSRKAYLEACLVLNVIEPAENPEFAHLRPECGDSEFLLGHIFGVPTGIYGFDAMFGGGGLMLADADTPRADGAVPNSEDLDRIGGRTVLCIGPFGSGKTLLSLQFAVEVARKGGIAWVIAMEQTTAECLYALEAIGVPAHDSNAFRVVKGGAAESYEAFMDPSPKQGALVFLRPSREPGDFLKFLETVENRLSWMSNYRLRLLVVDPVNAFIQPTPRKSAVQIRAATRKMFEAAKQANVNVWFTSEQSSTNDAEPARFAENIADTAIHLGWDVVQGQQKRYVEITKSRFQREESGRHGLEIEALGGVHVYPSSALMTRMIRSGPSAASEKPVPFGIPGMDRLFGSDIRPGDIVALAGPGKAKTLLGAHYLVAETGADPGECVSLFVTDYSQERLDRFLSTLPSTGPVNRVAAVKRCPVPIGYVHPGRVLEEIQRGLEQCRGKTIRLLVTNLSRWEKFMPFVAQDSGFGLALVALIRRYNAAAVVVCGDSFDHHSSLVETVFDSSDFVLQFQRREFQGRVTTLVNAVKTRRMQHQRESFELRLDPGGPHVRPAPLFRIDAAGNARPVKIRMFLHWETDNHKEHTERLMDALRATISPAAALVPQSRRFDAGLLAMSQFSAIDELQVFQVDEFQLPTVPASVAPPGILYSFSTYWNENVLQGRLEELLSRVKPGKSRFIAVPFYVNVSFFAVHSKNFEEFRKAHGYQAFPNTWHELAEMCVRWEKDNPQEDSLFFSCPVYEQSVETYNCMFLEILHSLRPPREDEYQNITKWFKDEMAIEAGYLFRQLCRRSHARGYRRNARPDAIVARHWYNTLNQELSQLNAEERAGFEVRSLFGESTTAGEWYLAVPSYSAAPEVGLRLIEQLTRPERETTRVELGVGLPTRTNYYNAPDFSDASVSRYFQFSRARVHKLLGNSIRRSQFKSYQAYSSTLSTHLQWILEMAQPEPEPGDTEAIAEIRKQIGKLIDGLVSNIEFLSKNVSRRVDSYDGSK